MKIFDKVSANVFAQFQTENMDPALALIGDGIKKEGLRNQVASRLLGFRAFEAITFDTPSENENKSFSFSNFYFDGDEVDLTGALTGYDDGNETHPSDVDEMLSDDDDDDEAPVEKPYPAHASYLNDRALITTKLQASPLLLSILPVLIDDKTPWRKDIFTIFEDGLKQHRPKHPGDNAPCYFVDEDSFGVYPGYLEMLKLLSETGSAPENLVGHVKGRDDRMWINQHLQSSLELLNAEVKRAFDQHLERIEKIQRDGYGESAPFKAKLGKRND